jgi:restriction system protein
MKELFNYKYDDLFNPTLKALHNLGGSGSVDEIEDQVASILELNDDQINDVHRGNTSKLSDRLAWVVATGFDTG